MKYGVLNQPLYSLRGGWLRTVERICSCPQGIAADITQHGVPLQPGIKTLKHEKTSDVSKRNCKGLFDGCTQSCSKSLLIVRDKSSCNCRLTIPLYYLGLISQGVVVVCGSPGFHSKFSLDFGRFTDFGLPSLE